MTTAARPTFDPAKGGSGLRENSLGKLSQQVSSRDLPGHLTLKERKPGQGTRKELSKKDFRLELEERERNAKIEEEKEGKGKFIPSLEQATQLKLALKKEKLKEIGDHKDALLEGSMTDKSSPPQKLNIRQLAQLDADEDFGDDNLSASDLDDNFDDDDNDDDDEDDVAELMAELERIKRERALEEEQHQQRDKTDTFTETSSAVEEYSESSFRIKRRWDDDVPFKNCAKVENDDRKKMFLNDTIRQEFHRKFMDKYIR